jgi:DNA-directed RNA polymerase specialized sigma24 family protein
VVAAHEAGDQCEERDRNTRSRLLDRHPDALPTASQVCPPDQGLELRRMLYSLPEDLAEVAIYHHLDALTYDEMAVVLGCSRRKVAYLLQRLRDHLENPGHC